MNKKESTDDKKVIAPQEALIKFLGLLCAVSRPGVCEFCTPGHKAGRGFGAMRQPVIVDNLPLPWEEA